jgi:hypothetical protein
MVWESTIAAEASESLPTLFLSAARRTAKARCQSGLAARSRTRMASGTTSFPIPSPGTTATGFGHSAKPSADYSPVFFARLVGTYLDALGLERVTLVDNSSGGLAALPLALSEPARVSALWVFVCLLGSGWCTGVRCVR